MKKCLDSNAHGVTFGDSPVKCPELDSSDLCGFLPNQDFLWFSDSVWVSGELICQRGKLIRAPKSSTCSCCAAFGLLVCKAHVPSSPDPLLLPSLSSILSSKNIFITTQYICNAYTLFLKRSHFATWTVEFSQ